MVDTVDSKSTAKSVPVRVRAGVPNNGSVAQRLVHLLHTEQVGGSNPLTSTNYNALINSLADSELLKNFIVSVKLSRSCTRM